jgi:acetylornithine deacetylase/succinyl-diaminopimelate desuccinylase-like protein
MNAQVNDYLETTRARQLDELMDWLRIPSISTIASHKGDVAQAADWLVAQMQDAGLENVQRIETAGNPLVYGDWLHAGADKPTVLVYGHYDVQPVDPLEQWTTPPFEPHVRDDDLYARGASDDKGQTFIHVKAVEALLQTVGSLPVNVKFIVEGEEEVGSRNLTAYVPDHADQLAADVCLISDTGILSPTQPVLIYGLRGGWGGEVTVTGPATDLHSGLFGGAIHNANQALCEIVAALHDETGRVTVPGFYDDVQPLSDAERTELGRIPYDEKELLQDSGAPAAYGEPDFRVVERIGARPTLEVTGMWGGYTGEGHKSVIPSRAHAKISCRLVPDQDPERIGQLVTNYLEAIAPPTVRVEVVSRMGTRAFIAPWEGPTMQAAARAYARVFGAEPLFQRSGGGIPITITFQDALDAVVVLMGFGLPDDNLHAPNEKMHLPNFYKGIRCSIAFMEELAQSNGG